MKWLYNKWYKSTIFLAVYLLIFALIYLFKEDYALFLIWLQTIVYLLHQFEEYVLPGGFVKFFNTKPLGSKRDDFPLNIRSSFWINIPIIFIGFPLSAILAGYVNISIGLWTAYFSIINAISHVGMFFWFKYNTGLIVSLFLNIPIGVYTIYYFTSHNLASVDVNLVSLAIGLLIQASLMVYGFRILKPKIQKNK